MLENNKIERERKVNGGKLYVNKRVILVSKK